MNIGKFVPTVATLIVAVVVMAGVAFPMIGGLSSETTTVSNDGASWIRMAYITDQSDYSVEYTFGDNISVAGQSGEWKDMILYADSQCTICIVGDYLVKIVGDVAYASDDPQTVTVSRSSGIVSIDGEPVSESTVSWAYVPVANGKYSSFGADTVPLHKDASNLAVVGGFAGVYAYNEDVSMSLGFVMDANVTEEYVNSVRWALESDIPVEETQPFHPIDPGMFDPGILNPGTDDPAVIDDPFDPSTLDPQYIDPDIGGNMLMSVPTPTHTDGDWGYDERSGGKARIVSYSGTGGGSITVPSTVGGLTVTSIGKGQGYNVFDTTLTATDLILADTITEINIDAFNGCSGFTGTLTLPSALQKINASSFDGCSGFTGTLVIPSTVTNIGNYAFRGCSGFTGLSLLGNNTEIGLRSFVNCTSITGNVTLPSNITTTGADAFNGCSGITSITFSNTFTTVSSGCFKDCTSITSLDLKNIQTIGTNAFSGCTGITGTLVIPSTVTAIGYSAFANCTGISGLTLNEGLLTLTNSTSSIQGAFDGCTGITGTLVIPSTITAIGYNTFKGCNFTGLIVLSDVEPATGSGVAAFSDTSISQVLNLSNNEWTTTSYGLDADEVRSDIAATSYMAPVSISETTTKEGPTFDLLAILPIVFVAGLLLTTAWVFIRK